MTGTTNQRPAAQARRPPCEMSIAISAPREDIIPQRIREYAPDVKLICVLRAPVTRCLSHYPMAVLAGAEPRTVERAADNLLQPGVLAQVRSTITQNNGYTVRGENFRILSGYWDIFRPEQLVALFASDLESRPAGFAARMFDLIGSAPTLRRETGRKAPLSSRAMPCRATCGIG